MSTAKRTFHSALWNHVGKMLEYMLMYLTSIVIARGLGVEENGRFAGLFSLSQLLLALCSFGLETSLNKFIPQLSEAKHDNQAAYILRKALLVRGAAFAGVTLLFYFSLQFFVVPFFTQAGQALAIVVAFTGIRSIFPLFVTMLTAQLKTALVSMINLAIRVIEICGVIVLFFEGMNVEKLFVFFALTSILHVTLYAVFCRSSLFGHAEPLAMRPIVAFGSIFWINTLVDFVLGRQGDVFFLSNLLPDLSQAGLYDVAFSIAQLATLAMTVGLTGVSFATFAKLAVTDRETMDRFYSFSIRVISLLTIPVYAFLMFNAHSVLGLLYSEQYLAATSMVQGILAFRIVSRLFGGAENAEYLLSQGKVVRVVGIGMVAATTNIVLNILLIPQLGGMGSVVASGCGNLLANLLAALAVCRVSVNRLQLSFWSRLTIASFVAAVGSRLMVSFEDLVGLLLTFTFFVLALFGLLTVMKPLAESDIEWIQQIDGRLKGVLRRFTAYELGAAR